MFCNLGVVIELCLVLLLRYLSDKTRGNTWLGIYNSHSFDILMQLLYRSLRVCTNLQLDENCLPGGR